MDEDLDFLEFVDDVAGSDQDTHDGLDETAAHDEGHDQGAMPDQDESGADDYPDGEMPDDDRGAVDETQDDESDAFVPKAVVKKVRHERREIARNLAKAAKENKALADQKAQLEKQLAYYRAQAEEVGVDEYQEPPNELTDELLERVRDGDTDAIAQALAIQRAMQQPKSNDQGAEPEPSSGHWTEQLSDDSVTDQLEAWSDGYEAGDARSRKAWETAIEVSKQVMSDPNNQSLSPDEIGAKVVALTKRSIAGRVVDEQTSGDGDDRMPESLSSAGGSARKSGPTSLLGLEGDELIAALDAQRW